MSDEAAGGQGERGHPAAGGTPGRSIVLGCTEAMGKKQGNGYVATRDYKIGLIIILFIFGCFIIYSELRRSKILESYGKVCATVVNHTNISGSHITSVYLVCRYSIDGNEYISTYYPNGLKVKNGECIVIKYSIDNPRISEIDYTAGVVPCGDL
ncbi:MAG: hypothetical protein JST38_05025 [Bacteroidetes bacterium]|nr:hypothetical protein [Bacteroidota bacterium]MBS1940219.1 hypothetical protein [Bacteroidota bacterium]